VAVDGKILFTFTDKDDAEAKMAVAASKEPLLFRKAVVHKIIHDARVDFAAVCIDPNATNAKITTEFSRFNAADAEIQNTSPTGTFFLLHNMPVFNYKCTGS
jgi:hypothetical protein